MKLGKIPTYYEQLIHVLIIVISALGQVMLYIDGMQGIIERNDTVQWLYSLIASKVRPHSSLVFLFLNFRAVK